METGGVLESPPMRVMVCIDDSVYSQVAFEYYVENFHRPENEVIVLHVSDSVTLPTYLYAGGVFSGGVGVLPETTREEVETIRLRNKAIEDKYNKKCCDQQIKNKVLIVSQNEHKPGPAIVDAAKKHNVNLIVVGTRGLGMVRRTIMGSTSSYVIHHCHIPTLVCPTPK
ncbi:universal stress protein YxiE-like [Styela clava]|uniref:uncharacterized protein LOC120341466 n=1 Tax=Styela clava TaxID=7725 RepID=UPI00193AA4BF|nr:uncharacterized protein LOC120341466 [Styela clava]